MGDQSFLVIAYDRLGPKHAGPAVRTLALAGELSRIGRVEVVFEGEAPKIESENIRFIHQAPDSPIESDSGYFERFTAALVPPLVALTLPQILESDIPVIVDLFDPVIWENLEMFRGASQAERDFQHERHLAALLAGLMRGDYFLVAGKRQQDLFLGALMALNRMNPSTWQPDAGPDQLIGLVPFGLPDDDPPSRDEMPLPEEFKTDGPLVVWSGGMWDWLNPELVVQAWPEVLRRYPNARLAFPGTRHPNPHVPPPESVGRVKKLAKELGVEKSLIFGSWLPRDEYLGLLAHAGCCVSSHSPGLEARYAVRTRFLDAIWMGLPLVVSGGDEYSGLIAENDIGVVVEPSDPSAFAMGIIQVLEPGRDKYAESFENVRMELKWSRMARPLIEWASDPKSTHGAGSEFFQDTMGAVSPKGRPGDFGSLMRRIMSKLKRR